MQHQTQTNATALSLSDLFTVENLARKHPGILSVQTLRWQLRHREENGLARCCVKSGKKLLISETRYEQWLGAQAEKGAAC